MDITDQSIREDAAATIERANQSNCLTCASQLADVFNAMPLKTNADGMTTLATLVANYLINSPEPTYANAVFFNMVWGLVVSKRAPA